MTLHPIKIAVAASALGNDPRQTAALARTLGFNGLQFDAWSNELNIPELSGTGRRDFLRLLSSQNVQLAGLNATLGPKGFGPGADVDRLLERLDNVLEAAAGLAAGALCLDVGPLPAPGRSSRPRPIVTPEQAGAIIIPSLSAAPEAPVEAVAPPDPALVARVDSAMAELGRRADRYGMIVALRTDLAPLLALERALSAAACPWFGVDLDAASVVADEWKLDETFARLGSRVRHVRGRDAIAGTGGRTIPAAIGAGSTDWPTLLADLDAAGFKGWLTIDPKDLRDRQAAAEAGRKRLELMIVR